MKKIITSIAFVAVSLFGFGQFSLDVLDDNENEISNTIFDVNIGPNESLITELIVVNTDSVSHTYKCRRTIYTVDPTDSTRFCWGGLCYNWPTNLSSLSLAIAPGDTIHYSDFGFHAEFISKMATITRTVHYQWYDIANITDSTGVTIRYNSTVGVDEMAKIGGTISNAFPNPANLIVSMKYDINEFSNKGSIVFYDMVGKIVKETELTDKKGTAKINVDDLNSGIYFYSFIVDGKAISTKKLVISSK
ncbi:MAG TPA: T9SS type A sorting domain-containing protein [Bacteroidia bacterium]|nr:T9SS type A sorting domain-containing protein [Bacteroidia bacterium]